MTSLMKAVIISSTNYQEQIYDRIKYLQNQDIEILKIYKDGDFCGC